MKRNIQTRLDVRSAATLLRAYSAQDSPCRSLSELCSRAVNELASFSVRQGITRWIDSEQEALQILKSLCGATESTNTILQAPLPPSSAEEVAEQRMLEQYLKSLNEKGGEAE